MNAKKLAIITITALIASTASIAESGKNGPKNQMPNRVQIVSSLIANHDENQDGALNSTELAASIESLYQLRQDAIRNHRDNMISLGKISEYEASKGIITLSLLPEDGTAILISRADTNQDEVLGAAELLDSTRIWHTLNLGTRPNFTSRS